MSVQIMLDYVLGDMTARYVTDEEKKSVGFQLLPGDLLPESMPDRNEKVDSLVQLKLCGDIYDEAYALGSSMRNGESVRRLVYERQEYAETDQVSEIRTYMASDDGRYRAVHHLRWKQGTPYVRIFCSFENTGDESLKLEMFESFSLGGLSPYLEGDGYGRLRLHRFRSVWSQEGRHEAIPLEDLQLVPAWDPHAVRCERFGQAGSMPVNHFFPFAAVEDTQNQIFWGAQIAHPASWQMELYRKDDALALGGGLADRDFGHWMKEVRPGERFQTPEAILSAAHTDSIDRFTARLTEAALEGRNSCPETERELPIIFNEYCTTWGEPSHKNIQKIVDCIKDKGFRYFVIDCGWYRENGVPWDISMGDYEPSKELFPEGLQKTADLIREAGMIPGIWFEIETVGKASRAYHEEAHLLHRDGAVLTSYFRRFWDMRDPWVERYLTEKVIGTLKQYGFGYMKIDYNETIGIGCDGAESLGEGLRRNMEASSAFFEKVKKEVPGIVLENCSSGGHRLEPGLMAQMSMASFSDAHECPEIPIIAANLHRLIHPVQSQIWAVIRRKDSLKRIVYTMTSTFLGRMCISGDVTDLSAEQWKMIERGMDFYRSIVPVIQDGQSWRFCTKIRSERHPEGWQALIRVGRSGRAYAVLHLFDGELPEEIRIPLPEGCPAKITDIYSEQEETIRVKNGCLLYRPAENRKAVAVRFG